MAIDIYTCNVCKEQFCEDCSGSLECEFCKKKICENCESLETKSDYLRNIICQGCYNSKEEKEKIYLKENRFSRKILNPAQSNTFKPKTKEDFSKLVNKLKGEENG